MPTEQEERYFKELELKRAADRQHQQELTARDAERKSHYMRCPKCGGHLDAIEHEGIEIDRCPDCTGVWLDGGELEVLTQANRGFSLFGFLSKR